MRPAYVTGSYPIASTSPPGSSFIEATPTAPTPGLFGCQVRPSSSEENTDAAVDWYWHPTSTRPVPRRTIEIVDKFVRPAFDGVQVSPAFVERSTPQDVVASTDVGEQR